MCMMFLLIFRNSDKRRFAYAAKSHIADGDRGAANMSLRANAKVVEEIARANYERIEERRRQREGAKEFRGRACVGAVDESSKGRC